MREDQWRCGHPRTPENTTPGGRMGGGQCRSCKTAKRRERYANDPAYAAAARERAAAHYDALDGMAYNARLLQLRRAKALRRRREREMREV